MYIIIYLFINYLRELNQTAKSTDTSSQPPPLSSNLSPPAAAPPVVVHVKISEELSLKKAMESRFPL